MPSSAAQLVPARIARTLVIGGCLVPLVLQVVGRSVAADIAAPEIAAEATSTATDEQIAEAIRQLGDSQYSVRRSASKELRQIGAEAFDQLHAATDDSDPEIAASAEYLLREISVRWVRNEDSQALRNLLRDYGRLSDSNRQRRIDLIAALKNSDGIAGLCRIARYDRSPIVSRLAALEIIRPENGTERKSLDDAILERELGRSSRASAEWLRRYSTQLNDPSAAAEFWQRLVEEESQRLDQRSSDTNVAIVSGLLWNLADLQRQLGRHEQLVATLDRMMVINSDDPDATAVNLLDWISDNKSWEVLDQFLAKHQPQLEQSKRSLYRAALARIGQGKPELAEQLALKASEINSESTLESFLAARELEEHSQFDWAVREYRTSIDDQRVASPEGVLARIYLANLLHDYEHDRDAAEVLEPLANAVNNKGQVAEAYTELLRYYDNRLDLPSPEELLAKFHFYRACQYHAEKDWKREQSHLKDSINFYKDDADVLIAMYRLPDADRDWKQDVLQRIEGLSQHFQQQIDENPGNQDNYNQWAWLIANTEGDFQKAVRYSHRSLELNQRGDSTAAGYLDTLGRCYYAAGDLENAVKYQRQAVEKVGYLQVMRRQLELFEKELAKEAATETSAKQ